MPRVSLPAPRLGAETRRVGRKRNRQPRLVENFVAVKIRDRNFCGRNQPVIVVLEFAPCSRFGIGIGAAEQILGKFGQLPGSEQRSSS